MIVTKSGLIAKEKFPLLDDAVKATLAAIQTDKDAKAAALTTQPKQTVFRPRPPVIASNEGTRSSNKGWATAAVQNEEPRFNPASIHAVMSEIDKVLPHNLYVEHRCTHSWTQLTTTTTTTGDSSIADIVLPRNNEQALQPGRRCYRRCEDAREIVF